MTFDRNRSASWRQLLDSDGRPTCGPVRAAGAGCDYCDGPLSAREGVGQYECPWCIAAFAALAPVPTLPVPMLLWCPQCTTRHVDRGGFATKPHHTHACQACGFVWRPALVATVGVQFLPGFRDEPEPA